MSGETRPHDGDDPAPPSPAAARVWRALPDGTRRLLESGLSSADLRTALMSVAAARAAAVRPSDVLARWRSDRFVRPAADDPRRVVALEARLWAALPDDVAGVELSPVVPLGSASAVGPVSQNRVVTTMRLHDVVSDSTNALAVEAASRRADGTPGPVHLAAAHRQLRAQDFGGGSAHFRLFALVSSARDTGSARTEAELLLRHLEVWHDLLAVTVPDRGSRIELTPLGSLPVAERLHDTVLPALRERQERAGGRVDVVLDPSRTRGRGYYTDLALRLVADGVELGDGGFTTWTAQLLHDAKERCLVSCVSTERLAELADPAPRPA